MALQHSASAPARVEKTLTPVRGDIQALRALAVGLVVLNHLWPDRVAGGYIGVDIFFVISGFLITAHLRREVDQTGRVDIARFWARRARRLLPAAFLVLLFSAFVSAVLLPITDRESAYQQIGAAGAYVLNWLLAATSMDYFATGSAPSPVTHFWSLSVEEQFYIAWPLLIVSSLLLARKLPGLSRDALIIILITMVFIGSLAWGIHSANAEQAAAYFQTTGRAWEFAAGGLLTFLPSPKSRLKPLLIPVAWASWVILLLGAYVLDGSSGFPGALALVPVIATAALIWIGDINSVWAPARLTSLRPIQFVGNISYSLYLWHWPLIVAAPFVLNREIYAVDKVLLLAIAIALAFVSQRFVEDPVRRSDAKLFQRPRPVLALTAVTMAALLVGTWAAGARLGDRAETAARALHVNSVEPDGCFGAQAFLSGADCAHSHTLTDPDFLLITAESQIDTVRNGDTCLQAREETELLPCSFGAEDETKRVNAALIGDSHARMWFPALDAIALKTQLRVTAYVKSACSPTLDPSVGYANASAHDEQCRVWRESAIREIAEDPLIDVVITSSFDRNYLGGTDSRGNRVVDTGEGYVAAWNTWLAAGKRVLVINEVPEPERSVPQCIAEEFTMVDPCTWPSSRIAEAGPLKRAAAAIEHPRFEFVDFESDFCDETVCHSIVGGIPAYLDTSHITAPFARTFASRFESLETFADGAGANPSNVQ
ncbi:acyltransferase family protein [Microterricola viridarii]|uniref:Peptidoglycan/LPS O-acetylase OafA/YrhL, contains acyltransferase and SGNH-hydrolase domains n=1 Tax=Microterricola viridarii TaxID=412690 RepID=A0A0X8E3X8_9MICO|nr:acyltransferase family protein [Microterricola viridarii]AMB59588.1 hypothetical protein AWU67_12720 [Microterricola viridarii]